MRKILFLVASATIFLTSCQKEISCEENKMVTQNIKKGVYFIGDAVGSVVFSSDMKNFERITYSTPEMWTLLSYVENGTMYCIGQSQIFGSPSVFESKNGISWERTAPALYSPNMCYFKNKVFAFDFLNDSVFIMQNKLISRVKLNSGIPKRDGTVLFQRNDTLFLCGGSYWNGSVAVTRTDTWVTKDGISWQKVSDNFPSGITQIETVSDVVNGKSYGFGFNSANKNPFLVSNDGINWSVLTDEPAYAYVANPFGVKQRYNQTVIRYKNKLYLWAGVSGEQKIPEYDDLWSFDGQLWKKEFDRIPVLIWPQAINKYRVIITE